VWDMYLDKILGTKIKIRILNELVNHPRKKYMEVELAKSINSSASEVNRQIKDLVACGLVVMETAGKTKVYSINPSHFIFSPLKKLFQDLKKVYKKIVREVLRYVTKKYKIECAILIGSFAKGKIREDLVKMPSDIDLVFIVKKREDIPSMKKDLLKYVERKINVKYGINIYPMILSRDEYIEGLKKDEFIIKMHVTGEVVYGKKPL